MTAWSIPVLLCFGRTVVKVAWRGASGASCATRPRPIVPASGPLRRTMPIPPRPGGVAIATIVSVVLNDIGTGAWSLFTRRDQHRLRECIADAFRGDAGHFRDRHVND